MVVTVGPLSDTINCISVCPITPFPSIPSSTLFLSVYWISDKSKCYVESATTTMGDSNPVYSLDEALVTVGFGKYQGLLLAYGGLGYVADAMEIMILSFIGAAVESEWHLSPGEKSMISTVVFAGMLVGSFFWGVISDTYGRIKGILGLATITSAAGLFSALSPNYMSLLVLRCIAGFGLGGMHIVTSWFLEFIPVPNRGVWMIVFSSFWTIGTIFEAGLAWIVMPNFGWRWLLALSSVPCFIVLLLYGLIPESPRFLCMKGRIKEAHNILEKAASLNGTTLQSGTLVLDHIGDDNEFAAPENARLLSPRRDEAYNYKGSPSSPFVIFSPKLIRTTLILWFLYFGNTFSYYGVVLLTSELSSGGSKCTSMTTTLHSDQIQNASLYLDVFVTSLAEVPGLIIAAFIVDRVGRKLCMIIMFMLASILLIPLLIHQDEALTTALLFGARALVSATFIVACIYAPELYPTSIRGSAVGIASAVGRIGGMICPLAAVGLVDDCKQTYAVILFQVMILGCALSVLLSPFETNGRNLVDVIVLDDQ
ncbi:Major facilitator superfamily protein [Perilla frutescens var. frutescens]|nr:Major facilitator superfamily protein [Perilla frutescens var. frutescens]